MKLFNITIFSLKRQKGKKLFLLIAMVLSFTTIITLFSFIESQKKEIESQFDEYGANIIITPETDSLSLSYGGVNLNGIVTNIEEINRDELKQIWTIPNSRNLRAVSPKLIGIGNVSSIGLSDKHDVEVLLVGVDLIEEAKIKSWWDYDGNFPNETNEVIVGYNAAIQLNLEIGNNFEIKDKMLIVSSILKPTGSQDDNAIIAPIEMVETILDKQGKISLVEVSALCSECPIDDMVNQISVAMPGTNVRAIRQVIEQRMAVIEQIGSFAASISIIVMLLCSLLIFSTITGSISDRKKEIGIFRALGFSKINIIQIILGESLIISVTAGLVGIAVSAVSVYTLLPKFSGISYENMVFNPNLLLSGLLVITAIGLLASLHPSISASKIDPIMTINSV